MKSLRKKLKSTKKVKQVKNLKKLSPKKVNKKVSKRAPKKVVKKVPSYRFGFKPTSNDVKDLSLLIKNLVIQLKLAFNVCTLREEKCEEKPLILMDNKAQCNRYSDYAARKSCEAQAINLPFDVNKLSKNSINATIQMLKTKKKFEGSDTVFGIKLENTFMDIVSEYEDNGEFSVAIENLHRYVQTNQTVPTPHWLTVLYSLDNFRKLLINKLNDFTLNNYRK